MYWSREMRQRRKVTHRITRYRGLSSRPKGLWSLQKMLKVSLLREILRSLRACPTSRNPLKGKRTPTLMVRRRSSMVRLRDATPSVREHAQPSLLTMFLTDAPLHENSSIRILGLLGTWTLSVTLFCIQLCLLSSMLYSSFDS